MTDATPLSMNRLGDREVLECGSPLPLCLRAGPTESGRGLPHSKTSRLPSRFTGSTKKGAAEAAAVLKPLRRVVLDTMAHTPPEACVAQDELASWTTVVVSSAAPARRVRALARRVTVLEAPASGGRVDVRWLWRRLGREGVTHVLVEGGGEVHAAFLERRVAHRVVFFYAPMILGGAAARKAVAGTGFKGWASLLRLHDVEWRRAGPDLWLTAGLD